MTALFSVTNYDQQQHYKDRGPTWIKLYNRLLDDYGFANLPDNAKWHLIGIFLLASRHDNRIPADPAWLARQVGATGPIDLGVLTRAGFIAPVTDDDGGGEISGNPASTEKKREEPEERREETENNLLSAGADPSRLLETDLKEKERNPYPAEFENFWSAYPVDPLMSKSRAFAQWRRMGKADRAAAMDALPAFVAFVRRQVNYRVVHACKYLGERRFEGFEKPHVDAAAIAEAKDRADRLLKRGKYAQRYE
jgi:hypothetical protein